MFALNYNLTKKNTTDSPISGENLTIRIEKRPNLTAGYSYPLYTIQCIVYSVYSKSITVILKIDQFINIEHLSKLMSNAGRFFGLDYIIEPEQVRQMYIPV